MQFCWRALIFSDVIHDVFNKEYLRMAIFCTKTTIKYSEKNWLLDKLKQKSGPGDLHA